MVTNAAASTWPFLPRLLFVGGPALPVDLMRDPVRDLTMGAPATPAVRRDAQVLRTHLRIAARAPGRWLALARRAAGDPWTGRRFLLARRIRDAGGAEAGHTDSHLRGAQAGAHPDLARGGADGSPSHDEPRIGPLLCVSRLAPGEGVDTLLTAFGMLADDRPGLRLEIIGGGPLDGALLGQARELGLDDRVDFRGPLPSADVQEALIRCALLVLPCPMVDSGEGAGLPPVLLEAMSYGTPAVTIDSVCLPRIVRDEATGLLVAPDDPAGLAVAIATLLDDPARAARLGAAGGRLAARLRDRDESEFA